ncbi:transposase (plasmid) [Methylocystis parvus]|uniref:Transposase n=1 Tax=Methylocystis parvus TaxID=134 RepID=A0A6B8MC79_9HYPH|nr:transposase [Methylocystis parvus]
MRRKALARTGKSFPIVVIQEAGLDGFWIHRVLENEGIESYVVDPSSITTSRLRRRAKTDRIDGEALLRALLAYKRGERRVCAMVKLTKRRLKRGVFHSVADLQAAINRFLEEHNGEPKPFTWTANPDKIIAAVRRGHQALDSLH